MSDESAFYTEYVKRKVSMHEDRLNKVLEELPPNAKTLLDIGCAQGRNLKLIHGSRPELELFGTDISATTKDDLEALGFKGVSADSSGIIPFGDATFDVVLCGEVIEHVADTDKMLEEIWRILKADGTLILTTPNLAYIPNRLLLLFGIQPLFTETSLRQNLGRKFTFLGQGGPTQGHLKIFTLQALLELMRLCGFAPARVRGYRFFQKGALSALDRVLVLRPAFAAGFVVTAKKARGAVHSS